MMQRFRSFKTVSLKMNTVIKRLRSTKNSGIDKITWKSVPMIQIGSFEIVMELI